MNGKTAMVAASKLSIAIVFVVCVFSLVNQPQPVKADVTCDEVLTGCKTSGWVENRTYCLNSSFNWAGNGSKYYCFGIDASNVLIDGQGYAINFTKAGIGTATSYIVYATQAYTINGLTVKNITAKNFGKGIYLKDTDNSIFQNMNLTCPDRPGRCFVGVYDESGNNNTYQYIESLSEGKTDIGFSFIGSVGYTIDNITADNYIIGLSLSNCQNTSIKNAKLGNKSTTIISLTNSSNVTFSNFTFMGHNANDLKINSGAVNDYIFESVPAETWNIALSNITIKNNHGNIRFLNVINGSGTNFSSDIKLSNNFAFVDALNQSGLNSSAVITFLGLSGFTNTVILKDGAVCPADVCSVVSPLAGGAIVFNVTGWSNYTIGEAAWWNLTDCKKGNWVSGNTYTLINDISKNFGSGEACFNIDNSNVSLNLNGHAISSTSWDGDLVVLETNSTGTTVANGTINHCYRGLRIYSNSNNIYNIQLFDLSYSVKFVAANYNTVSNVSSLVPTFGFWLTSGSSYNIFSGCTVKDGVASFKLQEASNNNIFNSTVVISTIGQDLFNIDASSNNVVLDTIIPSSGNGIKLSSSSKNNTFINVTQPAGVETVSGSSELIRKWYYSAYVNNNTNAISGASVTVYNVSGALVGNITTLTNGVTPVIELTDYVNNAGTRTYASNYTINTTKNSYLTATKIHNLTAENEILNDNFTLDHIAPSAVLGVNPVENKTTIYQNISFELSCSDNTGVGIGTLQLWGNWDGLWSAKATNSTPINGTLWNVTVNNIPEGTWKWAAWCNDSIGNSNFSSNRTLTINTTRFWFNSGYPYTDNSFRITEFVNVSGVSFTLAGVPYHILGADSYYLADYATNHTYDDDGNEINNSREYVLEILNEAHYLGINVIRTWAGMQGGSFNTTTNWAVQNTGGHHNLFEIGTPGNYSEEMFASFDWLISEASKRDIRLQLVLVNNWDEYGGMNWYTHQSPTVNKTYENVTDNTVSTWDIYHDQFYTDANAQTYFKNFINHMLNRNNTITGVLYKNDPTIFSWMLANEPRAKTDGKSRNLVTNWTINTTAYIKSIDTKHLVAAGIEGLGYTETWGEGTDIISVHNNTGVDYVTFAMQTGHWDYFVLRAETSVDSDWICTYTGGSCNIGTAKYRNFWASGYNYTYNNRYASNPAIPDYTPLMSRHTYKNWVEQNIDWANQLGMPIMLQEITVDQSFSNAVKEDLYNKTIHNFFANGGDGIMHWTLNHDNYYYSTASSSYAGKMDDGYAFYVTDDVALKARSLSVIDSFDFTHTDNGGGSWVTLLNNFKYDFVISADKSNEVSIDNCTLNLNIYNGTFYSYTELNSAITPNSETVFSHQFGSADKNFTWYAVCCGSGFCENSTSEFVQLTAGAPEVSLSSPVNNSYSTNVVSFGYLVENELDISNCKLYLNSVLEATDTTVSKGVPQAFSVTLPHTTANYSWEVECTDIEDSIGVSGVNNLLVDVDAPVAEMGTNPVDGKLSRNATVIFELSCKDAGSTDSLQLWGNWSGGWKANLTNSSSYGVWWNVSVAGIPEGTWQWSAWCNDSAGNSDFAANRTLTVLLNVAPSKPAINVPAENTTYSGRVNLTWNASVDPDGDVIMYNVSLNYTNGTFISYLTRTASTSYLWDTSSTANGAYKLNVEACDNMSYCNSTSMAYAFTLNNYVLAENFSAPSGYLNRIYTITADIYNTTSSVSVFLELAGPNLNATNFTMVQNSARGWHYNYTPVNVGTFTARVYAMAAYVANSSLTGSFTTQAETYPGAGINIPGPGGGGGSYLPSSLRCGDNKCEISQESQLNCPMDCVTGGIEIYPDLLMFRLEKPLDMAYISIKNTNNQTTYFELVIKCSEDATDKACEWFTLNQTSVFYVAPGKTEVVLVTASSPPGLNQSKVYEAFVDVRVSGVDAGRQIQVLFASDVEMAKRSASSITGMGINIGNIKTNVGTVILLTVIGAGMVTGVFAMAHYLRPPKPKKRYFA